LIDIGAGRWLTLAHEPSNRERAVAIESEQLMDITPQELRGSEVKEAFRGYHREEVDMLLERAAATIESLTDQLQRPRAVTVSPVSRNDAETIQRTLILAQRAADNAMAEAQEQARVLVEESESRAHTLVSDAEANARRIHDEERRQHDAEIAALLARRDRLQADADALETYASAYRDRVRAAIDADLAKLGIMIEAPSPRPEIHDVNGTNPDYSTTSR
jgi:DivIVA domain-containing protein